MFRLLCSLGLETSVFFELRRLLSGIPKPLPLVVKASYRVE